MKQETIKEWAEREGVNAGTARVWKQRGILVADGEGSWKLLAKQKGEVGGMELENRERIEGLEGAVGRLDERIVAMVEVSFERIRKLEEAREHLLGRVEAAEREAAEIRDVLEAGRMSEMEQRLRDVNVVDGRREADASPVLPVEAGGIAITGPNYFEDDQECGSCHRLPGALHEGGCRHGNG